ncbi:MAG: O-antigen ligase family protein [Candidatus Competibacteraceae bacterium]|nr:O-antigen ligase family protein [Candidatus Competibacteraceae bacterium]MCB1821641.1 O-antigen ligase family protein [Candidatus Competibacteraceae bacterium]
MSRLLDRLQGAFFRWGWLSPVVLPLTQLGGRGLFNTLAGFYALWGLLSFWRRRERLDRPTLLLYLALLGVFLLTIPGSVDPVAGIRTWLGFLMQSVTLLLIPLALRESPTNPDRLLDGMALFGALTLAGLYLLLPWYLLGLSGQPFDHETQLQEDNLPFLTPFLLAWLWRNSSSGWRYAVMSGVIALVLGYVALAEGRAALLGLIAALTVFSSSVMGWRPRSIALLALLVLAFAIAVNTNPFLKMQLDPEQPLDAFTAGRTALWRQALAHPPPRAWLGIGIGNGAHAGEEVLGFQLGAQGHRVKHLHNFVLDAWYETGLLGVSLLLMLMGAVFVRLLRVWRCLSAQDRQRAGVWLAAAAALLTAGLLSFSYTSRQLACYLFVAFGALIALSRQSLEEATPPAVVDTDPDRR